MEESCMIPALVIISSVIPIIFICIELKKGGAAGVVAKTASSLCFVALGAAALSQGMTVPGIIVLFGLVLGLTGDILLGVFKPGEKSLELYLPAGMLAFAAEHILVALAVKISLSSKFSLRELLIAVLIGIVVSVVAMLCEKYLLKFEFGLFFVPSLCYAFILASALAFYVITAVREPRFLTVAIGMAMFFISDIVLSAMYFGGKSKVKIYTAINLTTYYAGQILFAAAISGCFNIVTA